MNQLPPGEIPSGNPNADSIVNSPLPSAPSAEDQWLDAKLTLRPELKFDARNQQQSSFVVIEDPVRSKYFQVGEREYRLIASIDGVKTTREIVEALNENLRDDELPFCEESAKTVSQWLVQSNLVFAESIDNAKRLNQQASAIRRSKVMALINPISCKIRLFNPNRVLTRIQPYAEWMFSGWFLVLWCLVAIFALGQLYTHWDLMGSASTGILSDYRWIWLLLTWVVLKVVHEAAHGVACRRYGGEVPEAGLLLLLFTPMAYVNVTSMWRFPNRWHRMVVAGAGMYTELFISFLALILWTRTTGMVADVAFNVFIMSSVTTLLFNANPLMRFDGYFLLSDLIGIPNLYTKGTKWFGDRVKSAFFGTPLTPNLYQPGERRRVAIYGSMAFFWKISVSLSLIIGAGVLFHGAGMVLSLFGVGLWFGMPIYRQLKTIVGPGAQQPVRPMRIAFSVGVVGLIGLSLFVILQAPATKSAPAIVQFSDETVIRANASGFVREFFVDDGEAVERGQALIRLENPRLINQVVELERRAQEALIQSRIHQKQNEQSLAISERTKHNELISQLAEKRQEADGLILVAPFDGFVFRHDLENQTGSFAKRGDQLLTIAQRQTKEVVVSIDQRDLESIKGNEGESLRVALPGMPVFQSKLIRVNPRASEKPTHPTLCAHAGGPLAVRPTSSQSGQDGPNVELMSPRFNVTLELDSETSRRLHSGQRGRAFFSTCRQSLGSYVYLAASEWLANKIKIATQSAAF